MTGFQSKRAMARQPDAVVDILESVQYYCNENGCDDGYRDLTLGDIEYLAEELNIPMVELVAIILGDGI